MKRNGEGHYRLALAVVAMVVFVPLVQWVRAQGGKTPVHLTTDWSNRHMIFSQPSNLLQALALSNDARFGHQWLRQNPGILLPKGQGPVSDSLATPVGNPSLEEILQNRGVKGPGGPGGPLGPKTTPEPLRADWGVSLLAGGTNGAEMFPAKFEFDVSAPVTASNCTSDYVVYNTSLAGSGAEASIIAFNELYSTQGVIGGLCDQNGPSVYWSYDTGTGKVLTSPVISGDGTKVAYVESAGTGAILHILQFKAGEGSSISTPHGAPATLVGAWSSCAAGTSCIANLTFSGGAADTNSSPYYNYSTDSLYVGDNAGKLHKFTGVFLGTPTEAASWPVTVHSGTILSSPVMDSGSGNIFVGDASGRLSYVVDATHTLGGTTIQVGGAGGGGAIVDAPLVDGTVGKVYAVNGSETNNNGTLVQASTSLATITTVIIGGGRSGSNIHMGAFDHAYLTSAGGTGTLYMCGKDPGHFDRPAIFHLTVTSGTLSSTLNTALVGFTSASGEACSPLTEVYNPDATGGADEWIFFSVGNNSNHTGFGGASPDSLPAASPCSTGTGSRAGCLISINVTTLTSVAAWDTFAAANGPVTATVSLPAGPATGPGGANIDSTSGIIVDNVAAPGTPANQVSSIYFSLTSNSVTGPNSGLPECNGTTGVGCAAKLTQAALQ